MSGEGRRQTDGPMLDDAVSLDVAIRKRRAWSAVDNTYTQACAKLEQGIRASRADLTDAGCSPAEQPGPAVVSVDAAAAAISAARTNLLQAVRSRTDASALLAEAKRAAEIVLVQARDVSLARWVLGGLILLLLYLRIR